MNKVLGLLVGLFVAASAGAQTTLSLTGLSAQFDTTDPPTMSVLADTGTYAKLGFPLLVSRADVHSWDLFREDFSDLYLIPKPGYVIDSLSFTAQLHGVLARETAPAGAYDIFPALATNGAHITLSAMLYGQPARDADHRASDLNGDRLIDFNLAHLHGDTTIALSLYDMFSARVERGYYSLDGDEFRLNAAASIRLTDPVLTVYFAPLPVPEPQTWAMLAAGLLVLRVRRPKQRACARRQATRDRRCPMAAPAKHR
ncbi:MAG TPA: PEP-CTERM sorting domain-containing protein [Telluria sp.]|nr:PEP-CTERM sorting domain-containing protein [Telluria sp.]